MQFDEALKYLLSLGHETLTIKLGLRNTQVLLHALGNPHQAFSSVQIAGTNGKGSTAALLESITTAAGIRSGLYTSPHLISITERIRISGCEISRDDLARFATQVRTTAETLVDCRQLDAMPTFFEHVTAIALLAFKHAGVELAILETGLGGRLDATTCANAEIVAITPVALDHEEYLGDTIEKVAFEKAAIIRPGVAAIVAPQMAAVRKVIIERCELSNVIPIFDENRKRIEGFTEDGRFCVTFTTRSDQYEQVRIGLRGRHQITNVSLALSIAEALARKGYVIPRTAIVSGIERTVHPGRLESVPGEPSFLLDGAHNPASAQALREYLDEFSLKPLTLVFGAMRDKNLRQMAEILFPVADQLVLTEVDNPRTASLETLRHVAAESMQPSHVAEAKSAREAIGIARKQTPAGGLVCFTGSLYLIGEVRSFLCKASWSCIKPHLSAKSKAL